MLLFSKWNVEDVKVKIKIVLIRRICTFYCFKLSKLHLSGQKRQITINTRIPLDNIGWKGETVQSLDHKINMVGLIDHISPFPLNSRVRVHEDYGTVRYYGEVGVKIDGAMKLS